MTNPLDPDGFHTSEGVADQIRFVRRQVPLKHRSGEVLEQYDSLAPGRRSRETDGDLLEGELELEDGSTPSPGRESGDDLAPVVRRWRPCRVDCSHRGSISRSSGSWMNKKENVLGAPSLTMIFSASIKRASSVTSSPSLTSRSEGLRKASLTEVGCLNAAVRKLRCTESLSRKAVHDAARGSSRGRATSRAMRKGR